MNIDDPKITAYALDELDPATRAEIDSAMKTDTALAAEIAELRGFMANLRRELHTERADGLTGEQRTALLEGAASGNGDRQIGDGGAAARGPAPASVPLAVVERPRAWWRSPSFVSAAAACVIVGVSLWIFGRSLSPYREKEAADSGGFRVAMDETQHTAAAPLPENAIAAKPFVAATPSAATAAVRLETMPQSAPAGAAAAAVDSSALALQTTGTTSTKFLEGFTSESAVSTLLEAETRSTSKTGGLVTSSSIVGRGALTVNGGTVPRKAAADTMQARLYARNPNTEALAYSLAPDTKAAGRTSVGDSAGERSKRRSELEAEATKLASALKSVVETPSTLKAELSEGKQVADTLAAEEKALKDTLADSKNGVAPEDIRKQLADVLKKRQELAERALEESRAMEKQMRDLERMRLVVQELEQLEQTEPANTEAYDAITDNPFLGSKENPLSTFSIDVDTASYTNIRRMLNGNSRPPKGAVRIEELVNYFQYEYPQPDGEHPFGATMEVATCPWQPEHRLVRIGIKAREIPKDKRPVSNLVFLVDVSGSMEPENKLPLVKQCLRMLTDQLGENDSVAIAVYAGASGCVLEPTHDKEKVRAALDRLSSGGSTNGGAGIQLAYHLAQRAFKKGGTNRVILCTDGDFNVGISDQSQLVSMIQTKAKTGVFLSVLGFGMGNLKDSTLEKLADKGNGTYGYIDSLTEGRRVFVDQLSGTLCTVAKDVKIQVEFNPAQVSGYRLIGYENRMLAKEDFNDDTKDAGEIGAGHTVTALYEVVPAGKETPTAVDALKYAAAPQAPTAAPKTSLVPPEKTGDEQPAIGGEKSAASHEMLTVKMRYKRPESDVSTKLEFPLTDAGLTWEKSSRDFRWAAAVAGFGMMLRESPYKASLSWGLVDELAAEGRAETADKARVEFMGLIDKARAVAGDSRVSDATIRTDTKVADVAGTPAGINNQAKDEAAFERVVRLASRRAKAPRHGQDTAVSAPDGTTISALEGTFDQKTRGAVFKGAVKLKMPEFDAVCDRLVAVLKAREADLDPVAVSTLVSDGKGREAELKGGSILKATLEAEADGMIGISKEKLQPDGTVITYVGAARKATYDAATGDILLIGWPSVQQDLNKSMATSEETEMILRRNGAMSVQGPHKTIIKDTKPGGR